MSPRTTGSYSTGLRHHADWLSILLYLILVLTGWLTIYAADGSFTSLDNGFILEGRPLSQLVWIGISAAAAIAVLLIDTFFLKQSAPVLYFLMIGLLIVTIFIAPDIKGSRSWLVITETVRLQPAEFSKLTTALMLAWWMSKYNFSMDHTRDLAVAVAIIIAPMLIIILQSETGSALVYGAFIIVLYREGLSSSVPLFVVFCALLFILELRFASEVWGVTSGSRLVIPLLIYVSVVLAAMAYCELPHAWLPGVTIAPVLMLIGALISRWTSVDFSLLAIAALILLLVWVVVQVYSHKGKYIGRLLAFAGVSVLMHAGVGYFFENILQPHQQTRILVSLGLKDDPAGAGYNVHQSLIAIGSGGLLGKGYLQGTQTKLSYVPEQTTDFIFCTIGEEEGFIGCLVVLLLFLGLIVRVIYIAERQPEPLARVYGYSVACILFFHLLVNVGMVIGLVPVIGIPLPYISYGGSSLLSFTLLLFILLRLDASRMPVSTLR